MKTSHLTIESLNKSGNLQKLNIYSPVHQNEVIVPSIGDNYLHDHQSQKLNSYNHHPSKCQPAYSEFKDCRTLLEYLRTDSRIKKSASKCHLANGTDLLINYERIRNDQRDGLVNEINPLLALRRIILLYDNLQYQEAAKFIENLHNSTFIKMIPELPIRMMIEALPSSIKILESLFQKLSTINQPNSNVSIKVFQPDVLVLYLVKLFALQNPHNLSGASKSVNRLLPILQEKYNSNHPVVISAKKILEIIVANEPNVQAQLTNKKRSLDKAIEGMGHHGLVGTSNNSLVSIHNAIKLEFEKIIQQYKVMNQKLEDLNNLDYEKKPIASNVSKGPTSIKSNHQRQLSLRQEEFQERIIQNKTLLNTIEPCLITSRSLQILTGILQQRIEYDKDVLLQFNQLKNEFNNASGIDNSSTIAPVLMRFSYGYGRVLDLFKEISNSDSKMSDDEEENSDISGYHSGSESISKNNQKKCKNKYKSLFYKSANKLMDKSKHLSSLERLTEAGKEVYQTASLICDHHESSNGPVTTIENIWSEQAQDKSEIESLRKELVKAKQIIFELQEKEQKMKDRLADQAQKMLVKGIKFENLCLGDKRPTALIRKFGNLYAQARVDTLDALDSLPQLQDADELKSKLLFSVVVLSFCSVQRTLDKIRDQIRNLLQASPSNSSKALTEAMNDIDFSVNAYLRTTVDSFDPRPSIEEVFTQICATLYDYPCLKTCDGLLMYIRDCVQLVWSLAIQNPPYIIEYENRIFNHEMHVRFHTSDQDSTLIKTYLWPCLIESKPNSACVHKGVVIT